ncbi:hypothetical protein [Sulfitobacter sp.]|uniref:hypothetical protein n=1 Tax=unclassified Sulfitobacter TaxID=196795 RepID=UPI0025F3B0D5|nr:hypothetical protein [Sulfitobacter sp.]|tara:strand:- start:1057 stop:1527 length:471 start_codon:yes stop_codon:yes gene_type:complete
MKYFAQLSLKDLWTQTLREIDLMYDSAQCNDAEMSATALNTLSKALSTLRKDGPLSDQAAGEIGCIEELLHAAIARETLGFRNIFDGTNDEDHGAIGRILTVPVLSETGAALDALRLQFRKILAMRDLLAARVDAECQMARLRPARNDAAPGERAA